MNITAAGKGRGRAALHRGTSSLFIYTPLSNIKSEAPGDLINTSRDGFSGGRRAKNTCVLNAEYVALHPMGRRALGPSRLGIAAGILYLQLCLVKLLLKLLTLLRLQIVLFGLHFEVYDLLCGKSLLLERSFGEFINKGNNREHKNNKKESYRPAHIKLS